MAQCKNKKLWNTECGPHVYAQSEQAYATMRKLRSNQCIVVSGESGAGKTETNRQLMNYLVWRGTDEQSRHAHSEDSRHQPDPRDLGNAKTTRNNNSSRFGRYVLVLLGRVRGGGRVGADLPLERSRVTLHLKEPAYHVRRARGRQGAAHPRQGPHRLPLPQPAGR